MARTPKPWFRKDRGAWFVTIEGQRHNLGPNKKAAFDRFHQLMAEPRKRVIRTDSLLAVIDTFLDYCHHNRAPDTYEWYRYRLERFARQYPNLRIGDVRPHHIQTWIDSLPLSDGSKRNHGRCVKRCMRWAKAQGYIDVNPVSELQLPGGGKRETVLSEDEFATLMRLVGDRSFEDLLSVTWETGCRPQESLRVEARHVDEANQRWVFPVSESKTAIPRVVYLTDNAFRITRELMANINYTLLSRDEFVPRCRGASLRGFVTCTRAHANRLLGPSAAAFDSQRPETAWYLEFADGLIATIYKPEGDPAAARTLTTLANFKRAEPLTDWHVGSKSADAVRRVAELLNITEVELTDPSDYDPEDVPF